MVVGPRARMCVCRLANGTSRDEHQTKELHFPSSAFVRRRWPIGNRAWATPAIHSFADTHTLTHSLHTEQPIFSSLMVSRSSRFLNRNRKPCAPSPTQTTTIIFTHTHRHVRLISPYILKKYCCITTTTTVQLQNQQTRTFNAIKRAITLQVLLRNSINNGNKNSVCLMFSFSDSRF